MHINWGTEEMLSPWDPDTLRFVESLALLFEALNRPEEAMQLRKRLAEV